MTGCYEPGESFHLHSKDRREPSTQRHDIKTIWRFTVIISNLRCYPLREWKDPKNNCHICGRYLRCTLWFGVFQSKEWAVPSEPPFHLCFRGGMFVWNKFRILWRSQVYFHWKTNSGAGIVMFVKPYILFSYCFTFMLNRFSCAWLFVTLWTVTCQAPLSRQEYWSGLPCSPPGDLPTQGLNPRLLCLLLGRRVYLSTTGATWEALIIALHLSTK